MSTPSLFDDMTPRFDGATFDVALDGGRLRTQLAAVHALMSDGTWRTLRDIADVVKGSEAGVSARLRDLRKPRFGGHDVQRRRREHSPGTFEYRLIDASQEHRS